MTTRILCFGDSNVWGYVPNTDHERFSDEERFPKVLQRLLGSSFEVIEEGLNSRTMVTEDARSNKEGRSGSMYFIPCLDSHDPLDWVVLMLGTTELREKAGNKTSENVGKLLEEHFVKVTLSRKSQFRNTFPKLLIISPPIINEDAAYAKARYPNGMNRSRQLSAIYARIAKENNCPFVDASLLEIGADGVHLTKESHAKLAQIIADKIKPS